MSDTRKPFSEYDANQALQQSFNPVDGTLSTNGFLVGLVGRKITQTITTTTVTGDTSIFAFSENGIALYTYTVIYTDGTQTTFLSAERTA